MASHYTFDEEAYWQYINEVNNSEGFFLMSDYGSNLTGGIVRIGKDDVDVFKKAQDAARFAVEQYNEKENANLEYLKILDLNAEPAAGSVYYITLEAKNTSNNEVNHYQAKVWARINNGFRLEVFRLAPYAVKSSENTKDDLCCIRIENLQSWMGENYLYYKCFCRAKELLNVNVIRDEQSNQSQGQGILQFESSTAAEKVLVAYREKLMPNDKQSYKLVYYT